MNKQSLKKYVGFIIALMMFSVLPALVNAQKKCPDGTNCPKGYFCSDGLCVRFWTPPICHRCPWNLIYNYDSQSATILLSLDKPEKISVKIFGMTGRLVKTLADSKMSEGYHKIEWDAKDETGNAVQAGVYFLKMEEGNYTEAKKIFIVK